MKYMYILSITILWQFKTMKLVISNKTLKRCKIAHCKKVIVMISTKTILWILKQSYSYDY